MATTLTYSLFETSLGWCGLTGTVDRIHGCLLPEDNPGYVRARLSHRHPAAIEAPPGPVLQRAVARIRSLIDGANDDLRDLPLEMSVVSPFERAVYELAREILPGQTTTYGEIAHALGDILQSQSVGRALGRNPFAPIVPCHRVVAAGQKLGGFSATGGRALKLRLLDVESRWARDDLFGRRA